MQNVIYADVLVFINTVLTFFILLTVKDVCMLETGTGRLITGSLIGGVYSLIILAPSMPVLLIALTRCVMSLSIVFLSFRITGIAKLLKAVAIFYFSAFAFAGAAFFFSSFVDNGFVSYNNGYGYVNLSAFSLIAISVVCFLIFRLVHRRLTLKREEDYLYSVEITYRQKTVTLNALYDSADHLSDIYTGKPVIIVSCDRLSDLIGEEGIGEIKRAVTDGTSIRENGLKLRFLPVVTLAGSRLLPAFTAGKAVIRKGSMVRTVESPCVAVSDSGFENERYYALINERIFN